MRLPASQLDRERSPLTEHVIVRGNHPIWPSFGLIHGSRSSGDVKRVWDTFQKIARQNLNRNWQNGKLWWNDPDAVTLSGDMPAEEYRFHATSIVASGGMVLSGDDLSTLPSDRLAMLKKLLPPTGVAGVGSLNPSPGSSALMMVTVAAAAGRAIRQARPTAATR